MSPKKEVSSETDDRTISFSGANENSDKAVEVKPAGKRENNTIDTITSPVLVNGVTKKRPLDPTPPEQGQRRVSSSRRVPAPGATQEAIARLEALKALQERKSDKNGSTVPAATQRASASRKKVPAPGATQEAIARLATLTPSLHSASSFKSNNEAPKPVAAAPSVAGAPSVPKEGSTAPRRVPAPGATQQALARLQALKSSGMLPQAQGDASRHAEIVTGSVVWAKMPSYPWWPAQVQLPSTLEQERLKHGPDDLFVVFYGEINLALRYYYHR